MSDLPKVLHTRGVMSALGPEGEPISRTTLWKLERNDPAFPKARNVGGKKTWFVSEIAEYIATRLTYRPSESGG